MVLVCVPDESLGAMVKELAEARLDWAGRRVILCDSLHPSTVLKPLANWGAYVASARREAAMVVVDGHQNAVAEVKALVGRSAPVIRIGAGGRTTLLHALAVAGLSPMQSSENLVGP